MPRGKPNSSIESRFLKRTYETPSPVEGMDHCWIWGGGEMINGYGQLTIATYGTKYAHQWSSHNWNGTPLPIESGMCIKHRCDVKLCVNPRHLEYGTVQENIQEMIHRNPNAQGRIAPTDAELQLLRDMIHANTPRKEMARRIGHARTWIDRIVRDYLMD